MRIFKKVFIPLCLLFLSCCGSLLLSSDTYAAWDDFDRVTANGFNTATYSGQIAYLNGTSGSTYNIFRLSAWRNSGTVSKTVPAGGYMIIKFGLEFYGPTSGAGTPVFDYDGVNLQKYYALSTSPSATNNTQTFAEYNYIMVYKNETDQDVTYNFNSSYPMQFNASIRTVPNLSSVLGVSRINVNTYDKDLTNTQLDEIIQLLHDNDTSQQIQDAQDKASSASNQASTDGAAAQQDTQQATQSILDFIVSFFGVITGASATNCVLQGDLNSHLTGFSFDLCALNPPAPIIAVLNIPIAIIIFLYAKSVYGRLTNTIEGFTHG